MRRIHWKRWLLLLVAVVVLVGGAYGVGRFTQSESEPKITSELVGNRIESAQELVTTKYYYTNTASYENTRDFYGWKIPFTTKTFLVTYDGVINAGVDLKNMSVDVNQDKKTIDITLLEPKILSHEMDENSLKVFDEKDSLFNSIKISDYTGFEKDQKQQAEKKALDRGLLTEAKKQAQTAITSLLAKDSDIKDNYTVNVNFK
ncbi:MAG: DUF4230 domain-containing protein [Aerococcus sp.]|nr:DUF4230 domain-containing protein [Aerococcus sp.]